MSKPKVKIVKAKDVPLGEWFMVLKTHEWYKCIAKDEMNFVAGTQIGVFGDVLIDPEEEVELEKLK